MDYEEIFLKGFADGMAKEAGVGSGLKALLSKLKGKGRAPAPVAPPAKEGKGSGLLARLLKKGK